MANPYPIALGTLALLLAATSAGGGDFRILHAESIDLPAEKLVADATRADPALVASFEAYGRRFELELEPNERLLSKLSASQKAALARFPVYRGRLAGAPDSWVRLTRIGRNLQGMIWDGAELYVIEAAHTAERFMIAPGQLASSGTAVYRLADTQWSIAPAKR